DGLAEPHVLGPVHLAHAAPAETSDDAVALPEDRPRHEAGGAGPAALTVRPGGGRLAPAPCTGAGGGRPGRRARPRGVGVDRRAAGRTDPARIGEVLSARRALEHFGWSREAAGPIVPSRPEGVGKPRRPGANTAPLKVRT